jgi:HK97 family phage major capsid protein
MTDMSQKTMMEAVSELRVAVESKSAEAKAKVEKIEALLDAQEQKSQEIMSKLAAEEKARSEVEARLADAEKAMARPNLTGDVKAQARAEIKAVSDYLTRGDVQTEAKAYLRTDSDTNGGYLVVGEFDRIITQKITEISPIRQLATVQTIMSNRLSVPREDGEVDVSWVGEGKAAPETEPTFKQDMLYLNKMMAKSIFTMEAVEDMFVDIESFVQSKVVTKMAAKEGAAFISGDGVNKPEGFVDESIIAPVKSGLAANLTWDNLIELEGSLKSGFNPVFLFNRSTRVALQKMKSSTDYLWQMGDVAKGVPNTINGYGYFIAQDMDNIGANAFPVAFADLRQGYRIVQRNGVSVLRDPFTLGDEGKIKYVFTKRVGGGIVNPEAIALLKCAV